MCYAQSAPSGSIGEPSGRGQAAVMVIQAPDAAAKDQVSIVLGFTPQDGKTVTAIIGNRAGKGKKYSLKKFGIGRAWAETDALDQQIVAALKKSNWLVVQSVSSKGAKVQDTYNLSGFGKAYDAAVKACR
jgi:invasion protein IalB